MDIVIYTNPETLLHKREPHCTCWWSMRRRPQKFNEGDRVYFAVKGEILGYFICDEIEDREDEGIKIYWNTDSWVQLETIQPWMFCKSFRGFRYRWWES